MPPTTEQTLAADDDQSADPSVEPIVGGNTINAGCTPYSFEGDEDGVPHLYDVAVGLPLWEYIFCLESSSSSSDNVD